jgi:hypothetical protein
MMVVIHPDLRCALTHPSMTCMASLTEILFKLFMSHFDCAYSIICKRLDNIMLISRQSTRFGV